MKTRPTQAEQTHEEDDFMDEMAEKAFELSESEGLPFDQIMGELLGGIR